MTAGDSASPIPDPVFHVEVPIVVLSGPSRCGKSTIVCRLVSEWPVRLLKAVSVTTRAPRSGEVDGEDYYFLTSEEFAARRSRDEFVECAEVHGSTHWYGTLKSELRRAADAGAWALLEIDVQGALRVMEVYPQTLTIFVTTPSESEFERRLRQRRTESEPVIQRRLATAQHELQYANRYRYQVVNDDLDRCVREIGDIIMAWKEKQYA